MALKAGNVDGIFGHFKLGKSVGNTYPGVIHHVFNVNTAGIGRPKNIWPIRR